MGFLDKLKGKSGDLDKIKAKAGELAREHGDKIDQGIEKAADLADKKTKGKYSGKIDQAAEKAHDAADKLADKKGPAGPA
ncbi:hypothetical protein ASD11_08010 [Aeromicrobium sp. Root495]|uniref:antitoxin n=1 Tax=Aeromicrobium sp. Root495 TaxID=1736550 RepID=UPI0006F3EA30|nr:antitoxin [Aeromicrobium sp. Root495]KQY59496.1 hypothetical protein ASD11_08010 [Aeromicrobium sp. Root495]RYJ02336.1 MAG: antitoxin [Actinomycetales bacterium]